MTSTALQGNAQTSPPLPLLPNGIAYDAAGNLYFADTNRNQVYESSLAGVLTVVVGNGIEGFAGDNGPAANAQLNSPQGIAIGPDGTLYIADTGNQRIRTVTAGQITTLAGNGTAGFSGDGGQAAAAVFHTPTALAVDASGELLICDSGNHRVRRISNGTIATIAGTGVQGFAGDGTAATSAQLDTPSGIAVGSDGRIYIADSHNDRIRVIATNGTITTIAGSGQRGFAGDNGPALTAQLSLPRGLTVTRTNAVLFADSNNHRLRSIDANGLISTLAGSGVQGTSSDGSAASVVALDSPRGVGLSTFGSPVVADANNHQVREDLSNGSLYVPAGLAPLRTSSVTLTASPTEIYGQENATVSVQGAADDPQGTVQLLDGTSVVAQTTLAAGAATFPPGSLSAGVHNLLAAYAGDGVNPAAASSMQPISIGTAIATATADAATIEYGQVIPILQGSLSGVVPQDAGNVTAVFTTTAVPLSAPGLYPIGATLSGSASANYGLVLSPASGSLTIDQAASLTTEQPLPQNSYTGLPLVLAALVSPTTQGTPSGTVQFADGTTVVATATLVAGAASATYLSPSAGAHSVVATYSGDVDFLGSTSQAMTTTVGALPDFTIASSDGGKQTIVAGGTATYQLTVTAQPAPFTGVVDMSASGLPTGALVTFSPPQTIPGAGSAVVTMTVQTTATNAGLRSLGGGTQAWSALFLLPFMLLMRKRFSRASVVAFSLLTIVLFAALGCGARTISTAEVAQQIYTLQVMGTGTNLAGATVTHTTTVSLVVQ